MDQLKVQISEKDVDLFIRTNPILTRRKDFVDKLDLIQVFEEPFRAEKKARDQEMMYFNSLKGMGDQIPTKQAKSVFPTEDSKTTIGGMANFPNRHQPSD